MWTQAQPSIRPYDFEELASLFNAHIEHAYAIVNGFGVINGTAIAYMNSAENVRIALIVTDRDPATTEAFINLFHSEFPVAATFSFKRRGTEYTLPVSRLQRLINFNT